MTQPNVPDPTSKRADQINAIRDFADWLVRNPAVVVPNLNLTRHLQNDYDGTEAENLATVRNAAASIEVGTDESLDDRTVLRVKVNDHVWYELFAWHKAGRDHGSELERLRAEVAELRAAAAVPKFSVEIMAETLKNAYADKQAAVAEALSYSREADDPTPVPPARVPLHTGSVVDGGALVTDEAGR